MESWKEGIQCCVCALRHLTLLAHMLVLDDQVLCAYMPYISHIYLHCRCVIIQTMQRNQYTFEYCNASAAVLGTLYVHKGPIRAEAMCTIHVQ